MSRLHRRTAGAMLWLTFCMAGLFVLSACGGAVTGNSASSSSGVVSVVAAENFYGDIVKQVGGSHVSVVSILSDPNVDPHEYESNVQNAIAVTRASLVIENSGGYDSWMDRLLSASPSTTRVVIKGFDIAPVKLPDNEHVWYSIVNVQRIAESVAAALKRLDAPDAASFDAHLSIFKQSLVPVQQKMDEIKGKFAGTAVGLTETIYLYQSGPLGLNVLTPFAFQKAMAEGNDAPADSVVTADNQVNQHQIKVLIYNEQTVTPATTKLQNDARAQNIPIVPVTETMPSGKTYQTWMLDQLNALEQALGK
ncbi:MAG TPA: zinc ABC transporter substrate-binding protein [Ktedonobacteraceae bacterium]|nr:zinc ABC transporter substrate-binding protein [Ktedonobacteraceae bacterium]